jgi:HTH-type transcriptional regulator / antitoxin HipB
MSANGDKIDGDMPMLIRTPTDFGATIRDHRRRHGMDQQELAEKIGVSRQWVIEVEKGKARAQVGLVLRALDALGIALSLVTGDMGDTVSDDGGDPCIDIDQIVDKAREPRG